VPGTGATIVVEVHAGGINAPLALDEFSETKEAASYKKIV